jgi:uncharacterized membrane protein YhaH (DUF805 family)
MNERVWFYVEAGTQRGPAHGGEMVDVVRRLGPSTLVWREGLAEWVQAEAVPEFARAPWPAPPGPPPVPGSFPGPARPGDAEPHTLNPLVLWRRCFDWNGRFSRSEFAMAYFGYNVLFAALIGLGAALIAVALGGRKSEVGEIVLGVFAIVWFLLAVVISLGSTVRRLHDLGQSGWLAVISLVPCVNFVFLVYLLAAKGGERGGAPGFRAVPIRGRGGRGRRGRRLVLVVPMMIGIVAAIAIPSLLRAARSANEAERHRQRADRHLRPGRLPVAEPGVLRRARWGVPLGVPGPASPTTAGTDVHRRQPCSRDRARVTSMSCTAGRRPAGRQGSSPSSTGRLCGDRRIRSLPGKTGVRAFCGDSTVASVRSTAGRGTSS